MENITEKSSGFVTIHRQIVDTSFYTNPNCIRLALHLIIKANHKATKMIWNKENMTINRGQLITGTKQLAKELKLTRMKIRSALDILREVDFLTIKTTNKFSIITIRKYGKFQDYTLTKKPSLQPTNNQQITTNNNDNNDNKTLDTNVSSVSTNGHKEPKKSLHQEFVDRFKESYEALTKERYHYEKVQFILAQKLIKEHGYEEVVKKAKILGVMCRDQSTWFTKDGWGSFSIQKLYSRWNEILPKHTLDPEEKKREQALKEREKWRDHNARVNSVIKSTRRN